jgi:hypothetical protein
LTFSSHAVRGSGSISGKSNVLALAVNLPVIGASQPLTRRFTSCARARPCAVATSTLSPVTPLSGFWSAPQPIEMSAIAPGKSAWIASWANPAQSPLILLFESVTQWQA